MGEKNEQKEPGEPRERTRVQEPSPRSSRLKTPTFHALHAGRYERQELIARIQARTERALICFLTGELAGISREDTLGFADLLYNLQAGEPIDLLLHTHGGDIDAAEKLIMMVQKVVCEAELRVIVPDCAKSAGTLMTLGADLIVMSDSSELGPIDPQLPWRDRNGNLLYHSMQNHLDAYAEHAEALAKDPKDEVARTMLERIDPATIKLCEAVHLRARKLAEQLVGRGMFRRSEGNPTEVAGALLDTKRWQSHGQMIDAEDASVIGLNVHHVPVDGEQWREIWQLY